MKEFFDFRDKRFREFFIDKFPYSYDFKLNNAKLLLRIRSGEFTDGDLVRLCLELSFCGICGLKNVAIEKLLFVYKAQVVGEECINDFRKVCEEMFKGEVYLNYVDFVGNFFLLYAFNEDDDRYKRLVDIFLDEM